MKLAILAIAAMVLIGCASSGVRVTEDQTSTFVKGETTRSQVLQALGDPTSQTKMSDGTRSITYTYAKARARPATFIPIVGIFAGGTDTQASSVTLRFDANDKLIDITSMESAISTHH
ncbi:MAG: outer membrane protein assembly factor BamE [Betaproteobacteria bacterium]|nr:outer membrane protein assembly factor BamE [Betaproteobacteria bacterium]